MRLLILVCAVVFVAALAGCGNSSGDCIILSNGNKLCGTDAVSWCETTDPMREISNEVRDPRVTKINARTHLACAVVQGTSASASVEATETPDPDWTRIATPTATPKPEVTVHVNKAMRGADLEDEGAGALIFSTSRAAVTITGIVDPADAELRLQRANGNGGQGWEPGARSVSTADGKFSVRVTLRLGENDLRLTGRASGSASGKVLVAITRR